MCDVCICMHMHMCMCLYVHVRVCAQMIVINPLVQEVTKETPKIAALPDGTRENYYNDKTDWIILITYVRYFLSILGQKASHIRTFYIS